jgi:hypothetical protein|mmetsp:Transcript_368/g.869  ORF Transcript_368/g.869 Transcript_368/m.869 type:complete len:192 (-) Transcript_368:13-588(-)
MRSKGRMCKKAKSNGRRSGLADRHTHQFGNTSSGVKNNEGGTRTIHIINANTVRGVSLVFASESDVVADTYRPVQCLSPLRFRPNIIIDNLESWGEFDLIGKTVEVVPSTNAAQQQSPLRFRVVSRTVRCAGVGIDPQRPDLGTIDIPKLLTKHFPQHGPYLGVSVVVDREFGGGCGGVLCVGDTFRVVDD